MANNKAKKILVIEDDKFLSKVYEIKLSKEGYTLIFASDGNKGLEAIKSEEPDLILLDLVLPEKTGFEILEEVAKSKHLKAIPLIVISNLSQKEDKERAMGYGANDYISKIDSSIDEIVQKVKKILSN